MAPTKFGLFKTRSRDQAEQPSTENLLRSNSSDLGTPGSPVPSTSKGIVEDLTPEDISDLHIDSEDEAASENQTRSQIRMDESQVHYHPLKNQSSIDATSTLTLQDDELEDLETLEDNDGASTSADCNSIQLDQSSIAPSEDISVYCGAVRKPKKMLSREKQQIRDLNMWQASNVEVMQKLMRKSGTIAEQVKWETIAAAQAVRGPNKITCWKKQQIRDLNMWKASNYEVMQNLLSRSGTPDEQIKWEAIATARGLCTLTDCCTCADCKRTKYLAGMTDGDGGLGAAPLFSAISVGCSVQ